MEVFEEWIGNIRISVLVEFHPLPFTNFGSCDNNLTACNTAATNPANLT